MEFETIILIPTLNEGKNLEKLIPAIFGFMPLISVLVVDDSSKDNTNDFLESACLRFPNLFVLKRENNFGYGRACIDGFKWVLQKPFKNIITMDADFSHDYKSIPDILSEIKNHDVVSGSRYIEGGKIENWHLHRRILSHLANFYVRKILSMKMYDMTTGFNGYRKSILEKIDFVKIKSEGYAFLVELKYKLSRAGADISEIPITFSERRQGQSKMSGKIILESIKLPWKLLNS